MSGDNTIDPNPSKDPNDYLALDISISGPAMILVVLVIVYLIIDKI